MSSARSLSIPGASPERGAGIRRWLRLVLIEIRFSYAWLFMPLVIVAAIWFFNAWLWQPGRYWSVISSNIAQSFLLIGPAGAMWSAFIAGREDRSRLADLAASMPAGSLPRYVLAVGTPVAGGVIAYILSAAIVMWGYGREMTWGGPDWSLIGYGAVVVLSCGVVGAAFGQIVPGRFSPVIVSGSLFLYFVMSYSISNPSDSLRGWALLAYPRDQYDFGSPLVISPEGMDANEPPLLAGFLICGAVIAVAIALMAASHRRLKFAGPLLIAAVIGFGAAVPMTIISEADRAEATAAMSEQAVPVANPPLVCAGDVIITCLHQIDQRDLADVSSALDTFVSPVAGLAGVPERIEMRADRESAPGVVRAIVAGYEVDPVWVIDEIIPATFDERDPGAGLSEPEQVIVAWLLMPVDGANPGNLRFIAPRGDTAQEDPVEWQAKIEREAEEFGLLSPDEQRAWLEANWDALRAGELSVEDLP